MLTHQEPVFILFSGDIAPLQMAYVFELSVFEKMPVFV